MLGLDPAYMLVDFAKHIADAYRLQSEMTFDQALTAIKSGFDAEWANATDIPNGKLSSSTDTAK